MKKMRWIAMVVVVVAVSLLGLTSFAARTSAGSILAVVGPIAVPAQDDIGTCNNTWAVDSFNKTYTITNVSGNTYDIQVDYTDGTFVTNAGYSPGACEVTGGNGPGNGNTVGAGITGTMTQLWDGTGTGTLSGNSCTPETCVNTASIISTLFSTWTWTSPDRWTTMTGTYEAGTHGTWHDTWANWPYNDTGDIATLCPGDSDCDLVLDTIDNCPAVYNPDQTNSDGGRRPNGLRIPGDWASNPAQDKMGDACDPDDDNDRLPDTQEFDTRCPYRRVADSDQDGVLDGYEVANGFDPCNAASRPTWTGGLDSDGDGLWDGTERIGYNTCAFTGDTYPGWATCAVPKESDGDGCPDMLEVLDLNGDRFTDNGDQYELNRRVARKTPADDPVSESVFDVNKDGFVDNGDQFDMNRNMCGTNPRQLGCPMCPPE